MPELKRNFTAGRMNKDLDERLVPNGEYRDAMNIEVSTSEDSDIGTIQTTLGNTKKSDVTGSTTAFTIASIADIQTNKIYSLIHNDPSDTSEGVTRDMIVEYDPITETNKYVFVDIWRVKTKINISNGGAVKFLYISLGAGSSTNNVTGIRKGMSITGVFNSVSINANDDIVVDRDPEYDSTTNSWKITLNKKLQTLANDVIVFKARRTLNFSRTYLVTGINIIDDMLFWTDGNTEPKKINIIRSIKGTGGNVVLNSNPNNTFTGDNFNYHTRLVIEDSSQTTGYKVVANRLLTNPIFAEQQHLTVLRPAPQSTLELEMSRTTYNRANPITGVTNRTNATALIQFYSSSTTLLQPAVGSATSTTINITFDQAPDFRLGDVIILTNELGSASATNFTEYKARLQVSGVPQNNGPSNLQLGIFEFKLLAVSQDLNFVANGETFFCLLEEKPSIFEFKFPKFSYRYKYTDGEYSAFAPWSEVAFLPGSFNYEPKHGHNKGMANHLKTLKLKKYVPEPGAENGTGASRPGDVVEIDILYKESNSTNIYTVKTVKPSDPHPVWPDNFNYYVDRGELVIDTEMIHAVLPSDQFLRPFDVVPKKAKSQEVTGNRLLYGNYTQNYDYDTAIDIETSLEVNSFEAFVDNAEKSVKSMRNYQLGVVYLDGQGRETPVLVGPENGVYKVSKTFSDNNTKLTAKLTNTAPTWAKAFKFYVKEPSNEYYNLAMDRWYNALDGNIWLSFSSSERNKINEETYLILKKAHDSNKSVADDFGRYKVLAIENEAPDFIKKTKKSLGFVFDNTAKTRIGNGGDGFPLAGFVYVEVTYSGLNNSNLVDIDASGTVNPKSPHLKDDLFLKIHSSNRSSVEYEIVNISNTGAGGNYKIQLSEPLGDDVDFTSTDGTYANRISGISLELIQYEVQNKPEFDGRFFVKIENDLLIQQRVLGPAGKEDQEIYAARQFRYVKAVDDHPRNAGMTNVTSAYGTNNFNFDWGGSNFGKLGGQDHDEIDDSLFHKGHKYWKEMSEFLRNGNGSGFFIDDDTITSDPPLLSGAGTLATKDYDTLGSIFDANSTLVSKHGRKVEGFGNFIGAEEPKGIYRGSTSEAMGSRIDISWVGFTPERFSYGTTISGGDAPKLWSQHGQDIQAEDYAFSKEFFQIGTTFRFSADPEETIYTIKDVRYEHGIRNYTTLNPSPPFQHPVASLNPSNRWNGSCFRDKWSLKIEPPIVRTGGVGAGSFYPTDLRHDGTEAGLIELVRRSPSESAKFTTNPGVWETEPREDVDLDVYYEASATFPTVLNSDTNEMFAAIGSKVSVLSSSLATVTSGCAVESWSNNEVTLTGSITSLSQGEIIVFTKSDGGKVTAKLKSIITSTQVSGLTQATVISFYKDVSNQNMTLAYSNCFSFPQGIESDRVRDDFNQTVLGKGVKASTVLGEPYKEEHRASGLIFSGIYNSMNGVNNLNQFIASSGITKELNNQYGSIQKLFSRDNNVVAFCEDKILKIYANKDALFNADGNVNLTATNKVLGTADPFSGEYGISKNPESFAQENFRAYFTDKARGAVLRLSKDGLTVISKQGMVDYFRDNMPLATELIGSYDKRKSLYNITLSDTGVDKNGKPIDTKVAYKPKVSTTVSFSEKSKGWTSFKSFVQESGLSLDNNYYTFNKGDIYLHHSNLETNNFYETSANNSNNAFSSVTVLLNEQPSSIKSFNTLNYEGTQSKIDLFQTAVVGGVTYNDGEFYNLSAKKGWYVDSVQTDQQTGKLKEFIEKEGKWFNYLYGETTTLSNLDSREFSYQGIGMASAISHNGPTPVYGCTNSTALNYNPLATIDDESCILAEEPTRIRFMWLDIISPCDPNPEWSSELNYNFTWSNTLANIPAPTSNTTITNNSFNTTNGQTTNDVSGETLIGTYINPVYTKVISANTGHMFVSIPTFSIITNNATSSLTNYNVQQTNLVYDSNQNLISATFTISFTMPNSAMSVNDNIVWNVCTKLIPDSNTNNFTLTVQDDPTDH